VNIEKLALNSIYKKEDVSNLNSKLAGITIVRCLMAYNTPISIILFVHEKMYNSIYNSYSLIYVKLTQLGAFVDLFL